MKTPSPSQEPPDFTLVLGGPLYQLFRRVHLTGNTLELLWRRVITIPLLAWLPLLILSAFTGQLLGGKASVPFVLDVEVHVRLLVALPLLIFAELIVHERMRLLPTQFLARHLIPESARAKFDAAIASASRLRNSVVAELLLIAFVYGVVILIIWPHYGALRTTTWYSVPTDTGSHLTLVGRWYLYVSIPILQFLFLRWYFRVFIWARFLWQVSRIDLSLIPTHPDRVGGLGFLSNSAYGFVPLAVAHGAILSGWIANRIFHLGSALPQFKPEIAVMVVLIQGLVFAPLLLFAMQLARAKRTGLREYGTLADRYCREFDAKWLRGGATVDEQFVGSADIQSLADLGNSFEVVQEMRVAPITRNAIVQLAVATLLPVSPLLLTIMPLDEWLRKLAGVLL
jgi:hypothetical protein